MARWNYDELLSFFDIYEKHDVLWDINHNDHANRRAREKGFYSILDQMKLIKPNLTMADLKSKLKIFKTTYRLELVKVEKSKRTATCPEQVHKPRLSWYARADALWNESMTSGAKMLHFTENDTYAEDYQSEADTMDNFSQVIKMEPCEIITAPEMFSNDKQENEITSARKHFKEDNTGQSTDEFDDYGKTVANHLRKLPINIALECENFITNYLIQERLNMHNSESQMQHQVMSTSESVYSEHLSKLSTDTDNI